MGAGWRITEGEGFEPPEHCCSVVFKTTAFVHSATPPAIYSNPFLRDANSARRASAQPPDSHWTNAASNKTLNTILPT